MYILLLNPDDAYIYSTKARKNVYSFIKSRRWLVCITTVLPYVIYVGNDRIVLVPRKTITMIIEWNKTEMV